ncbi:MAG: hypothetical protein DI582_07530 [Azospirillum brasilense]|nr:MAG: hypothetical protein DI582_07530 [Azospirillum brasilense]
MVYEPSTQTLFDEVRSYIRAHRNDTPERTNRSETCFTVPYKSLSLHGMEILSVLASALGHGQPDPLSNTRDMAHALPVANHLDHTPRNGFMRLPADCAQFPANRLLHQLDALQAELAASMRTLNDGAIEFTRPETSKFPLDFVLRAAFPVGADAVLPETRQLQLQYALPPGEFRTSDGQSLSGRITTRELWDLQEAAEQNFNYDALDSLSQARCVRAVVPAEHVGQLQARLGLSPQAQGPQR